jgi:hypothetical protein
MPERVLRPLAGLRCRCAVASARAEGGRSAPIAAAAARAAIEPAEGGARSIVGTVHQRTDRCAGLC